MGCLIGGHCACGDDLMPWWRRPEEYAAARLAFTGCGFSKHTTDALARNDLGTPAKLLALPAEELRYLHGIGKKGRAEIEAWPERVAREET
jgi:hypothetical protein